MPSVDDFEPLLRRLATAFGYAHLREDLIQEGRLAAWKAITTHDPSKGVLASRVRYLASRAMREFLDQQASSFRMSVRDAKRHRRARRAGEDVQNVVQVLDHAFAVYPDLDAALDMVRGNSGEDE